MNNLPVKKERERRKKYKIEVREYFKNLNFESEELVYNLVNGTIKTSFERFTEIYPIDKQRIKSKDEIAQSHDICIENLLSNVNHVTQIVLKFFPNFFKVYNEKMDQMSTSKTDELESFYGTSDTHLIKKIMSFFDQKTSTIMLLYCPLYKPEGTSVDFITNYTNLSKPETREMIENAAVSFRKIVEELKIDSIMSHRIKKILLTIENQTEVRIIQLIFGLYDGNRYSVSEVADKLKVDQEVIKDTLVSFSKMLHNNEKKLH